MPRIHPRIVAEREEHGTDRADEGRVVAARQVGSPDRTCEQRVADEQVQPALTDPSHLQADAARAVPRGVVRTRLEVAERDHLARRIEAVDRRRLAIHPETEHRRLHERAVVQEQVVAMQVHGHAECAFRGADTGDVIDVRVGQQDVANREVFLFDEFQQAIHLIARVDDHPFAGPWAGDNEAVLVEGADRLRLDYDHAVILAILDDLLFTSKIRGAATHAGATLTVARSAQAALDQMRAQPPSLVILDLNNPRTDPIGILTTMKGDATLASIPTVGYVSHVDTATIAAAREAGAGEVMARSAFVNALPELLTAHR